MKNDLTFIIPNYQTPDYMLWCYNSIRKNLDKEYDILIIDDGSKDTSWGILKELEVEDANLAIVQNDKNYGIAYTYNRAVDHLKTEKFVLLHTDMYIPPKFDLSVLNAMEKYDFVTTFRTEPPLYPPSPDKIQKEFGNKLSEFKEQDFLDFVENYDGVGGMKRTCFPWATTKTTFNRVNGIDEILLRYMCDDDDFYLRIAKAGFTYWQDQTHPGCYHMTSRTTKYKDDNINMEGSPEWNNQYSRSTRNFIRKWGRGQNNAYNADMSINTDLKKYDIGFVVNNCDANVLYHIEPWCSTIYTDIMGPEIYKAKTSENTMYDMDERVKPYDNEKNNAVIVKFDASKLTNDNFKIITQLQSILEDSGESNAEFELDIFTITIGELQPINEEKLISGGFRNTDGYPY